MGQPKTRSARGKGQGLKKAKRARKRAAATKKALGIRQDEIVPHIVGRGRWLGMRDYAPQENGPVIVRKVQP